MAQTAPLIRRHSSANEERSRKADIHSLAAGLQRSQEKKNGSELSLVMSQARAAESEAEAAKARAELFRAQVDSVESEPPELPVDDPVREVALARFVRLGELPGTHGWDVAAWKHRLVVVLEVVGRSRLIECGVGEVRAGEVRIPVLGAKQIGPSKIGLLETRPAKIGGLQVRTLETRARQSRAAEVSAG